MSSQEHRKDIELLLKQLKQLNDLDHTEYHCWDFLHWFPTNEDKEQEAEKIPLQYRTEEQNKILRQKQRREEDDKIYDEYVLRMIIADQPHDSRKEWDNTRKNAK